VRSVVSRLARLERLNRLSTGPQRLRIQYGYLKTLPDDYIGTRHVVTVRQLPPVKRGEDWFQWEERPGPEPASNAISPSDESWLTRLLVGPVGRSFLEGATACRAVPARVCQGGGSGGVMPIHSKPRTFYRNVGTGAFSVQPCG
jgi:hypothetical protein